MKRYDKLKRVGVSTALVLSLGACGTKIVKGEKPLGQRPASTGLTAEEFAAQNNGRVAWFPGNGRKRGVEENMSFCNDIDF